MKRLLFIALSFACIFPVNSQIDIIQSKAQGFPAGQFVMTELDAVPSEGNLLLAFLGSPTDSSNHFFPTESGWIFLTDEIFNARLHVFYKIAGASENKKKTFLTPHVNSNYTAILAEYGNTSSIAGFVTKSSEDQVNLLPFGSVNALTGQRAVAAFVARQLSTDEIVWSDDFEARVSVTVDPEGSPMGSAMSDFMVTTDSEIQTTASWAPLAEPGGILLLLSEELLTYDILFNIRDEADEPLSGAVITFNGVKKAAGEYAITGIRSGTYDYMVEKEGYLTYKGRITVVEDGTEDVLLYALTPGKYYVSADGNDSNPGNTPRAPWKTINKVRTFSFQKGDDVYFRCGDTFTPSDYWNISWEGTAEDPVVIGSYYTDGANVVHGVSGSRPVISGSNYTVPGNLYYGTKNSWQGLIHVSSKDYIHIKNIHIFKSGWYGIHITGNLNAATNSAYFLIQNVKTEETYMAGINITYNPHNYGIVENCEISGACWGWYNGYTRGILGSIGLVTWGGSISIAHSPFGNGIIRKNYIHDSWGEGIIHWTWGTLNSGHDIIEDNVLFNVHAVGIYLCNTNNVIVRRNLVLGAGPNIVDKRFFRYTLNGRPWNGPGIRITGEVLEGQNSHMADQAYNIYIHNNMVAGMASGITVASEHDTGNTFMENVLIYNNTLIANGSNIGLGYLMNRYSTNNIEFKNNISYCPPGDISADGSSYLGNPSYTNKFNWDHNAWTVEQTYAAGQNDVLINSNFEKNTGWQDLMEVIEAANFRLVTGSSAVNTGVDLSAFFSQDFFLTERPQGTGWDIGAHELPHETGIVSRNGESTPLNIYPNPAESHINVEFEIKEPGQVELRVFNIAGMEIISMVNNSMIPGKHEISLEMTGLLKGLYFIRLKTESGVEISKVVYIPH